MIEKRTPRQIAIYLLVGGGTALLEVTLFQFLYLFTPLGASLANVIAVVTSTACNFALNGTVTFRASSNLARSALLYLLLFTLKTVFSTVVISFAVEAGAPALIAKLATMACIVTWNYFLYRKVVFR